MDQDEYMYCFCTFFTVTEYSHTISTMDPSHQMVQSHYQWRSLTSNRSPCGLICRLQTKAWTVRSRCQTRRLCSSKPDPPDLLQSSRRCPAITRLEACSRPTSHHMDPSDPPGHGISVADALELAGDRSFWRQIATAGCYSWSLCTMMMMMMMMMNILRTLSEEAYLLSVTILTQSLHSYW